MSSRYLVAPLALFHACMSLKDSSCCKGGGGGGGVGLGLDRWGPATCAEPETQRSHCLNPGDPCEAVAVPCCTLVGNFKQTLFKGEVDLL